VLRQRWAVVAATLVLAVYAAALTIMPKGAFWSPDEGAKFIQMHSIGWQDGIRYGIAYGGRGVDPHLDFYPSHCRFEDLYPVPLDGGQVKFHWPLWFPLVSRGVASLFGLTGLYIIPLLSGWMVALVAGYLMARWLPVLAPAAIVAVGLATPIAFFSLTFWEHTLATLLGLVALAIVASPDPLYRVGRWLVLPLLIGAAGLRIEMALFAIAVGCAWIATSDARASRFWLNWRRLTTAGLIAAGGAALLALSWLALPERHRWMLTTFTYHLRETVTKLPYFAETLVEIVIDNPGNQAPVIAQSWRYLALAACFAVACAAMLWSHRREALLLLAGLAVLFEFSAYLVIRPEAYLCLHGFLPIAPLTILALYGLAPAWRARQRGPRALVVAAGVYAVLVCGTTVVFLVTDNGVVPTGLEWGNRYLLSLYPLAILLALGGWQDYRRSARPMLLKRAVSVLAAGLLACGFLLEIRGVWMLIQSRRLVTAWQDALRDGPPVMTDVWWLPAAMAPLFVSQPVHCVRGDADLSTWYPVALGHGVDTFTFASFRAADPGTFPHDGFAVVTEPAGVVSGLHLTRIHVAPASTGGAAAPAQR
jgi:hypothetical protein